MQTRRKFLGIIGALCALPGGLWALGRKKPEPWTIKRLAGPYDNTQQFGVLCEPDAGWHRMHSITVVEGKVRFLGMPVGESRFPSRHDHKGETSKEAQEMA